MRRTIRSLNASPVAYPNTTSRYVMMACRVSLPLDNPTGNNAIECLVRLQSGEYTRHYSVAMRKVFPFDLVKHMGKSWVACQARPSSSEFQKVHIQILVTSPDVGGKTRPYGFAIEVLDQPLRELLSSILSEG